MGLFDRFRKKDQSGNFNAQIITIDQNGSPRTVDMSGQDSINMIEAYSAASKGVSYEKSGKWSLAIEQHKKAIALSPKDNPYLSTYHTNLGVCYANVGKIGDAIRELELAVKLDPNSERARKNLENAKLLR